MITNEMSSRDDIYLDEGQWLKWIDISLSSKDAQDIDDLIEPIDDNFMPAYNFWRHIEANCVAGCCGLGAFDFSAESIEDAVEIGEADVLYNLFDQVKSDIQNHESDILKSIRLNNRCHKDFFVELLEHILRTLDAIRIT